MTKTLVFLHTSPAHIATFDGLLEELQADLPVRHLVDEALLDEARCDGMTPALRQRIATTLQDVDGEASVVLCTCSTIGRGVEEAGATAQAAVMRVDRAMAEEAVRLGSRVVVVATLASTLAPTRDLLREVASQTNRTIELFEVVCTEAWAKFEQGDQAGYLQSIAAELQAHAAAGDVVVLAQASMAEAVGLCKDLPVPVLSSPRLGLQAALATYQIVK